MLMKMKIGEHRAKGLLEGKCQYRNLDRPDEGEKNLCGKRCGLGQKWNREVRIVVNEVSGAPCCFGYCHDSSLVVRPCNEVSLERRILKFVEPGAPRMSLACRIKDLYE